MSDANEGKTGIVARIQFWLRRSLVADVPPEMERCEFDCKDRECTMGKWESCENRRRSMRREGA